MEKSKEHSLFFIKRLNDNQLYEYGGIKAEKESWSIMGKYVYKETVVVYECIGEGTPIVFFHGWGVDRHLMSGCFEPVFEGGLSSYRRIYIDLPGMGKSIAGKDIRTSDDMLEVLYHFVKDVIGTEIILVGESYGGYLARGFVHEHQDLVKSLILLCPLVYPGYRQGQVEPLHVIERDEEFLQTLTEEQYNGFTFINVILTKKVWKLYERDILPGLELQDSHFLENVLDGAFSFDVDDLETPFTKPCLIVVGKHDTEVGYKDQFRLLEKYPNASYVAINNAGHNLQIEQAEWFQSTVKNWFSHEL